MRIAEPALPMSTRHARCAAVWALVNTSRWLTLPLCVERLRLLQHRHALRVCLLCVRVAGAWGRRGVVEGRCVVDGRDVPGRNVMLDAAETLLVICTDLVLFILVMPGISRKYGSNSEEHETSHDAAGSEEYECKQAHEHSEQPRRTSLFPHGSPLSLHSPSIVTLSGFTIHSICAFSFLE